MAPRGSQCDPYRRHVCMSFYSVTVAKQHAFGIQIVSTQTVYSSSRSKENDLRICFHLVIHSTPTYKALCKTPRSQRNLYSQMWNKDFKTIKNYLQKRRGCQVFLYMLVQHTALLKQ